MNKNRRLITMLGLFVIVIMGVAATDAPKIIHENLQILPKDISNADLDSVMNGFERALGVSCDFCHSKDIKDPTVMNYASDDKPEKEITRKMMRMTAMINKEFFDYAILYKADELMAVSCKTCHLGNPRPNDSIQQH